MERRLLLQGLVGAVAFFAASGNRVMASSVCGQAIPDFWQISLSRADMPFTFTDAYRLHSDNVLEFASWSDQHQVTELADHVRLSDGAAQSFRNIVTRRLDGTDVAGDDGAIAGRAASYLEVGAYAGGQTLHSAITDIPRDVADFIAGVRSRLPVRAPGSGTSGHHVWTKPVGMSPVIDLDLAVGDCSGPVSRAVAEGLTTPRLLTRLTGGAERYLSGDLSARMEFVAKLSSGFAAFGVLRA